MQDNNIVELRIRVQPKQKEALQKSVATPILFYGGAKGGGKSFLVRAKEILRRLKYPNTKGLIIRKTLPELRSNHIQQLFKEYPIMVDWFNKSEKIIHYPNGSTTEFSYLQNTNDVYTYQGREYDDISMDEITQHEELAFKILRSSLRTTTVGFKPTMLLTGNPGGVGHEWVKRIFVDKRFKPEENPADFDFVQAKVSDNLALMAADPEYVKRLYDLPEHLRKAYLDGDWNIFAGMAFDELSENVHIVEPFELPRETRYFAGYDHGYNHPFSFVLCAMIPDGTIYVVKHYKSRLIGPSEIAQGIRQHVPPNKTVQIFAGNDLWSNQRDGSPSVYEQFLAYGLRPPQYVLIHAFDDRKQGVAQLRKCITFKNKQNKKPELYFFRNCLDVFTVTAGMQFDGTDPEDVLKVDAVDGEGGDDAYDALRYAVMGRVLAPKIEKKPADQFQGETILQQLMKQKEYEREEVEQYE